MRARLSRAIRALGHRPSDRLAWRLGGGVIVRKPAGLVREVPEVLDDGLMDEIAFGGAANEIIIRIVGRERPDELTWEDGNWLVASVHVDVGAMTANLDRVALRAEELLSFAEDLADVYRNLSGTARLAAMEACVSVAVEVHPNGAVGVEGILRDKRGPGNELQFALRDLDQTHLLPVIDSLQQMSERYPVVGAP